MPRVGDYRKLDPERAARVKRHEVSTVIPATVLAAFFEGPPRFTAEELARRAGVHRTNVYRWLYTMEELGWVKRCGESARIHKEQLWCRRRSLV